MQSYKTCTGFQFPHTDATDLYAITDIVLLSRSKTNNVYCILVINIFHLFFGDLIKLYTSNNVNSEKLPFYGVQAGLRLKAVVKTTFS